MIRRSASRSPSAAAAAAIVAGLLLVACSSGDASSGTVAAGSNPTTTATAESTPTTAPPAGCSLGGTAQVGTHPVGRIERTTVDPSRPTVPRPQWADRARPDRTLPYVVLYPAAGPAPAAESGTGTTDAAPSSDGPFPVIMWSHGMGSYGGERNDVLARWASAGYVVVAPTFPLSSRASDASDLPNQPLDVAFVLEQIRATNDDPAGPLHGLVRADCVALAGHSMGGGTTLAATFDPRAASISPAAFVDISGLMPDEAGGVSLDQAPPVPALVVHGALDATVPLRVGQELIGRLHAPTWFLVFPDGDHNNLFVTPQVGLLDTTVTAFLDAELKGSPGRLDALATSVDASGMATLQAQPAR